MESIFIKNWTDEEDFETNDSSKDLDSELSEIESQDSKNINKNQISKFRSDVKISETIKQTKNLVKSKQKEIENTSIKKIKRKIISKDLEFETQDKLLKKEKKIKKDEQKKIIENSNHKSWSVLRTLKAQIGEFYFTDNCFCWSLFPLDKLNIHVVGIDIGSIHLGISGLDTNRHLIYFSLTNISKKDSIQLKYKTSTSKLSTDTDFDTCIKVVDEFITNKLFKPIWKCTIWLCESQYGSFFDGKKKIAGNSAARMISCAIQLLIWFENRFKSENDKIWFGNVHGKAKYSIAPILVDKNNRYLLTGSYDDSMKGQKKSKQRKIVGKFHAFAVMDHLKDPALEVLLQLEENVVNWSSKNLIKDELDKIYDITDSFLIAQRKWYKDDEKVKRKLKSLK